MSRKIVAISGYSCCQEDGGIKSDMSVASLETLPIDKEIICLAKKDKPNFLLIAHAQPLEKQDAYFEAMRQIYEGTFNCECRMLRSDQLSDIKHAKEMLDWADIVYEGGGSTLDMINLWKSTGFDKLLKLAWEDGKVMCGLSAGANCWFGECITDALRIKYGPDQPLIAMDCLGFYEGFLVPHCDEPGREESSKEILRDKDVAGILLSNCTALEIVDDEYRIISSKAAYHPTEPYAKKTYWKNGQYIEEKLELSSEFRNVDELIKNNTLKF